MGDISRHTGINIGGLNTVSWIYREDVAVLTFTDTTLYCGISLKTGRSWNFLYGTPETIQLESEQQDTPAGLKYLYKLKILVPKDRAQVESELFRMTGRCLIVKLTDKNGTTRLFGTIDSPMKMTSKLLKPPTLEGFNGFELLFSGEFQKPAGFIPYSPDSIPPDQIQD